MNFQYLFKMQILLAHKDEFSDICKKTVERCQDKKIRLGARNMQAKLLHAQGKTEEAFAIYHSYFPIGARQQDKKQNSFLTKALMNFVHSFSSINMS